MTKKLSQVTDKLSLSRLQDFRFDPAEILFRLQDGVNNATLRDLKLETNYNSFAGGLRAFQSNLTSYIDEDQKVYINTIRDEINRAQVLDDQVRLQFYIYDALNLIRDGKVSEINYSTYEGETPGAITYWITERIWERDRNVILGIFGDTGSGKSRCGYRLGLNVAKMTGRTFELKDISFNYEDWLMRVEERRQAGTLKGSIQILDEGGNTVDAQNWFDSDVKDAVQTLRTNRFQNACTIIISPNYGDIAKRARGLFHATLIPWKEWGMRYMELTDKANIDYDRGISSWKIDLADVDPMTGETYPGKLKAALGNIRKVECLKIKKGIDTAYDIKSNKYKLGLQQMQLKNRQKSKQKMDPKGFIDQAAAHILANESEFVGETKRTKGYDWRKIQLNWLDIGEPKAKLIRDRAIQLKKQKENEKNTDTIDPGVEGSQTPR